MLISISFVCFRTNVTQYNHNKQVFEWMCFIKFRTTTTKRENTRLLSVNNVYIVSIPFYRNIFRGSKLLPMYAQKQRRTKQKRVLALYIYIYIYIDLCREIFMNKTQNPNKPRLRISRNTYKMPQKFTKSTIILYRLIIIVIPPMNFLF